MNADAIEHIENDAIALREKSSAVVLGTKVIRIGFEQRPEVKVTPENPDRFKLNTKKLTAYKSKNVCHQSLETI